MISPIGGLGVILFAVELFGLGGQYWSIVKSEIEQTERDEWWSTPETWSSSEAVEVAPHFARGKRFPPSLLCMLTGT